MADKKISQLSSASTPLAGTEVLPIVQSSATVKVATDDLTVKNIRSNATTGILQIAGPAAAATRIMTVPDANFTVARTDAAQTFTGEQSFSSPILQLNGSTPFVLLSTGIPFVFLSSGTMGNNGALSGITAVANAYASAYCYLPANAISTGSAAGWYYAVFSSTTAATIYNNVYTSGTPTIPSSPTAFSTTGPGAYTQVTSTFITGPSVTLTGNTLSKNGSLRYNLSTTNNNSAGSKQVRFSFGGVDSGLQATTTQIFSGSVLCITNRGDLSRQFASFLSLYNAADGYGTKFTTFSTASNQSVSIAILINTATDTLTVENLTVFVTP